MLNTMRRVTILAKTQIINNKKKLLDKIANHLKYKNYLRVNNYKTTENNQ